MIHKKTVFACMLGIIALAVSVNSCKKTTTAEPLEPIAIIKPDSLINTYFPGDMVDYEIKFTTDRPINWIKGMYDIDTTDAAGYVPAYPDTLFYLSLDTLNPRVNLYTYTGSYHIPDSLSPYDIVRFKISFEAGNSHFTTGQNYPVGVVSATKTFKLNLQ